MSVPRYEPLCRVFPHTAVNPVTTDYNILPYWSGFEYAAFPPPSWTSATGGGGTVAQSAVQFRFGNRSLRINSPNLASVAYARHNVDIGATGKHGLLCWVYVNNYYGATANDNQSIGAYAAAARYEMEFCCLATATTYVHSGTTTVLPCGPLATGRWYKLFATLNYTTSQWEAYIDNVLMAAGTEGIALSAPTILYMGDMSVAVQRGDFFWDGILYGRVEDFT